jgi:hypothetical protein
MAVGSWDTARRVLYIPYSDKIRIVGLRMSPTKGRSRDVSWTHIVDSVRVKAREAYTRDTTDPVRTDIPVGENVAHGAFSRYRKAAFSVSCRQWFDSFVVEAVFLAHVSTLQMK